MSEQVASTLKHGLYRVCGIIHAWQPAPRNFEGTTEFMRLLKIQKKRLKKIVNV